MSSEIADLISNATEETRDRPDIALGIEISDRMNNSESQ